jgi:hypothetical protein
MTPSARPTLEAGIEDLQHKLLLIKRRLHVMQSFECELDRVTRGKELKYWDDLLYMVMLDSRDALVIHLASFAKGLHKHHLRDLLHHWLKQLRRARKQRPDELDPALERILSTQHDAAFARLFPKIDPKKRAPGKADVQVLRDAIETFVDRLRRDRNANRAHAFELLRSEDMLSFEELAQMFAYLERVLNDVRLIATATTMSMSAPLSVANPDRTVVAIVDQLVTGGQIPPGERDAFYERLHREHDDRGGTGPFNERAPRLLRDISTPSPNPSTGEPASSS